MFITKKHECIKAIKDAAIANLGNPFSISKAVDDAGIEIRNKHEYAFAAFEELKKEGYEFKKQGKFYVCVKAEKVKKSKAEIDEFFEDILQSVDAGKKKREIMKSELEVNQPVTNQSYVTGKHCHSLNYSQKQNAVLSFTEKEFADIKEFQNIVDSFAKLFKPGAKIFAAMKIKIVYD